MSAPMPIALLEWKPVAKNTLIGVVSVRLGKSLAVRDCLVHRTPTSNSSRLWVALPSKPMIDRDGHVMRDARGKIRYSAIMEWLDRDAADRFGDAVIAAIEAKHPGALRSASNDTRSPDRAA